MEKAENELKLMNNEFLSDAADHFEEMRRCSYVFYCKLKDVTSKLTDAAQSVSESSQADKLVIQIMSINEVQILETLLDHAIKIFRTNI